MLEIISKVIHDKLWVPWTKKLVQDSKVIECSTKHWKSLWIPYEELSEEEKDKDRYNAQFIIDAITNRSNSYLNDRKAIDRLKSEYLKYNCLIIGFDFDCTIYDYHKEGLELQPVIDLLVRCSKANLVMCMFSLTLKDKMTFDEKVKITNNLGIRIDYVNGSPILRNDEQADCYCYKPFFSIFLDDRCGLSSAYNTLKTTLDELEL